MWLEVAGQSEGLVSKEIWIWSCFGASIIHKHSRSLWSGIERKKFFSWNPFANILCRTNTFCRTKNRQINQEVKISKCFWNWYIALHCTAPLSISLNLFCVKNQRLRYVMFFKFSVFNYCARVQSPKYSHGQFLFRNQNQILTSV